MQSQLDHKFFMDIGHHEMGCLEGVYPPTLIAERPTRSRPEHGLVYIINVGQRNLGECLGDTVITVFQRRLTRHLNHWDLEKFSHSLRPDQDRRNFFNQYFGEAYLPILTFDNTASSSEVEKHPFQAANQSLIFQFGTNCDPQMP
jgi:hypothetical protein